mmetsp:Transcript_16553/g.18880  ORF Transcript_16553/g.18880 Transcript_16553/m.18880 type:complete len:553 (+) Transcript_16553:205-1863(+)
MGRQSLFNSRIGTSFSSRKWLTLDPQGFICVSISYFVHIYALITIYQYLISSHVFAQVIYYVFYIPTSLLALMNLFTAQHTNPGAVPLGARPLSLEEEDDGEEELTLCSPTNTNAATTNATVSTSPTAATGTTTMDNGKQLNHTLSMSSDGNEDDEEAEGKQLLLSDKQQQRNISPKTSMLMNKKKRRMRGIRRCKKCNDNYKPTRAHHDSVTGRCIIKFDHFCPWIGNAVGALNHKFFFLFVFYTFFSTLISLILLLTRMVRCSYLVPSDGMDDGSNSTDGSIINNITSIYYDQDDQVITTTTDDFHNNTRENIYYRWLNDNNNNVMGDDMTNYTFKYDVCENFYSIQVIILFIMSISFLFFTCCMLFEQIDAIETNTSKIARLKMKMGHADAHEYARVGSDFNEMFGGSHPNVALHWFLPTQVKFPFGRTDKVMGYEYKEIWYGEVYREDMDDGHDDDNNNNKGKENVDEEVGLGSSLELGNIVVGNITGRTGSDGNEIDGLSSTSAASKKNNLELDIPLGGPLNHENDVKQRGNRVKKRLNKAYSLKVV